MSRLQPEPGLVEGPAFPLAVKLLATALMAALALLGTRTLASIPAQGWSGSGALLLAFGLAAVVFCYVWMLRSRTGISATHIRQTWISDKQVAIADITQIKLIHLPRLAWLVTPRLVVRTRGPGSTVFHTADPKVLQAFVRLTVGIAPMA